MPRAAVKEAIMVELLLLAMLAPVQDAPGKGLTPLPRDKDRIRPDVVLAWNDLALDAIRKARTPPPLAARNLAVLHVALADTANTIYQTHAAYLVGLRATEPINPDVALAACGQRVLADLYPAQGRSFDRALQATLDDTPTGRPRTLGLSLGRYVADRILDWRRDDGHDQPAEYADTREAGVWQPTPPGYKDALLPRYGQQPLFGVKDRKKIRFAPPPELAGKAFAEDLAEVRAIGGKQSRTRTAEQAIIAWFWNDDAGTCTPPGHWNQIAREVALNKGNTVPENARLFALLNVALADAAILCWECKYRYRLYRPVTAVRLDPVAPDRRWLPLLDTPPFPSYTSGHSTFSGAAATILARYFGADGVEFTVGSDGLPGTDRSFQGFWEAATEAGRSRVYGGIHYECDNREGLALGKAIALEVWRTRLLLPEDPTRGRPKGADGNIASTRRERP